MFVFEKFLSDHRARLEAWKQARDKWVKGGGEYSYRSKSDYEDTHPRPGTLAKNILKGAVIGLATAGMVIFIISLANSTNNHHKAEAKAKIATSQTTNVKTTANIPIHVGDKVQVVYGDYKDSVGIVIKVTAEHAIIKLTDTTLSHAICDVSSSCNNGGGTDNGQLLGIADLDNLVPYK